MLATPHLTPDSHACAEVSGRVLGRLQAVGRELREVRQLLECERREHQAALASRDAMLTKLTEDVRSLKVSQ